MKSLGQKIEQISGLIDTKDVSHWENGFLKNVCDAVARNAGSTTTLTAR